MDRRRFLAGAALLGVGAVSLAQRLITSAGAGGFTPPGQVRITDAMSSWWCLPKAVESNGQVYLTAVTSGGSCKVWSFPTADPSDLSVFTLMTNESDDHNAAALLVPDDKVPLVFYCRHNKDTLMRWRKGTVIGDITSLGAEQQFAFPGVLTYSQIWRRPGTDEIHLWTRESIRYWRNKYSTNWGTSWSTSRRVFDFGASQQGYIGTVPIAADPDRIRVALTGHPTSSTFHDVYYCEIDMDSGDITNLAGSVLGNLKDGTGLPLSPTSLDLVVDTDTAGGHNARLFDVGDGPDPEVLWGDWTTDSDMVYYHRRWNGSSWDQTAVVAAGETFGYHEEIHYNGGIIFPRNTGGGIVYVSREAAGTWYLEQRALVGGSWIVTWPILSDADSAAVRPFPIEGGTDHRVIAWHDVTDYPRTDTASLDWAADMLTRG